MCTEFAAVGADIVATYAESPSAASWALQAGPGPTFAANRPTGFDTFAPFLHDPFAAYACAVCLFK